MISHLEDDYLELMDEQLLIEPRIGLDAYNNPIFGDAYSALCRVQRHYKMIRDTQGREVISSAHIYLYDAYPIQPEDKIVLPDGKAPVILNVTRISDDRGPYFTEIFV